MDAFINILKVCGAEGNADWTKKQMVKAITHRLYQIENVLIFSEKKVIFLFHISKSITNKYYRPARRFLLSATHRLHQGFHEVLQDWTVVSSLYFPIDENMTSVEQSNKYSIFNKACNSCKPFLLDKNKERLSFLINSVLSSKPTHTEDNRNGIMNLLVGLTFYYDSIFFKDISAELNMKPESSSVATDRPLILDATECSCQLKLGISSPLSNLKDTVTIDPLYLSLEDVSVAYFKNSIIGVKFPNLMELIADETTATHLDAFDKEVIAIPVDHEPYQTESKPELEPKSKPKSEQEKEDGPIVAFYGEDLVYGKTVSVLKNLDKPAFAIKCYHTSYYLAPLKEQAETERVTNCSNKNKNQVKVNLDKLKMYEPLNKKELLVCSLFELDLRQKEQYTRLLKQKCNGEPEEEIETPYEFCQIFGKDAEIKKHDFDKRHLSEVVEYKLYKFRLQQLFREVDSLFILPEEKLILEIETKSSKKEANFQSQLKRASQKTEITLKFLKSAHGDILSEGWKYVKAISFPRIKDIQEKQNLEKIKKIKSCSYCMQFILDSRILFETS